MSFFRRANFEKDEMKKQMEKNMDDDTKENLKDPRAETAKKAEEILKEIALRNVEPLTNKETDDFLPKPDDIEQEIPARNLSEIAKDREIKREMNDTADWLNQQMQEFSSEKLSDKDRDGVLQDFDRILTKNMFDKKSLDAILTHGAVENLEKLYGNAQSELLKAKRKAAMLKLIVEKAHLLLEQQAASLLE